jgi:hypothetical protein
MSPLAEQKAVVDVVFKYLTGAYEGNVALILEAFHPQATMCGYLLEQEVIATPEFYIAEVEKNPSPKETGEKMQSVVSHVEVSGPVATVTVQLSGYWGSDGTDHLHLIKEEGNWKIISKTFWIRKP